MCPINSHPRKNTAAFILVAILLFCGCASTYKPFNLPSYNYGGARPIVDGVSISYVGDLQRISRNGWYAKKEHKWDMRAVAVKVHNGLDQELRISLDDIIVYAAGQGPCEIIRPEAYSHKIKQRVGIHMLHALYGPWAISWQDDGKGNTDVDFYYIPVGALVGLGNAIRASRANKANAADIERLEIWDRVVPPGETLYGIVLLKADPSLALRFEARE